MAPSLPRITAVTLLALLLAVGVATPASAHGRGSDATNYRAVITAAPDLDGVTVRVHNADEFLGLTNDTDVEVEVPGYKGEPYLRIGPDGTFENANSEAAYLNDDRYAQVTLPPGLDVDAEPDWRRVSGRSVHAWHDHRIHWMSLTPPTAVQEDPSVRQLVNTWAVPIVVDGQEHLIEGELWWEPGGNPLVWLAPALVLVSLAVLPALRTTPDFDAGRWPGLARPAGAVLAVIAAANVIHLVDDLTATPIPLTQSLVAAIQTAVFIAIGVFGGIKGVQGREGAFTAIGVGAGAVLIGQGLLYWPVLGASQAATVFPAWLTRAVIAVSIAQIVPLATAAIVGNRRLQPDWDDQDLAAEAP